MIHEWVNLHCQVHVCSLEKFKEDHDLCRKLGAAEWRENYRRQSTVIRRFTLAHRRMEYKIDLTCSEQSLSQPEEDSQQ